MKKQLYELTQGQNLIVYAMRFIKYSEISNIGIEFQIDDEIDQHILVQAAALAVYRNPNNKVRFTVKDKITYQYFSDEGQDKIDYKEFENEEEYENYINALVRTPFPNKQLETQLYRLSIIKKPNGKFAICGCFNHFIYDTYSGIMTFKEILEIYKALKNGESIPKETLSPLEAYEDQKTYLASKKYLSDKEFYEKEFETEPRYTILSGAKSRTYLKKKKYGLVAALAGTKYAANTKVIPIERELVTAIDEYSAKNRITPQVVYILALRTYLGYVCNSDDVEITCTVNRRTTAVYRKAGGSMADGIQFRTIMKNDMSFKEGADYIFKTLLEYYKHSNFPATAVSAMKVEKFKNPQYGEYESVVFTYQNTMKLDDNFNYSVKRIPNGREWVPLYFAVIPSNSNGDYVADYSYMPKLIKGEVIQDFHQFMIQFISEGIKEDNISINELLKKVGK